MSCMGLRFFGGVVVFSGDVCQCLSSLYVGHYPIYRGVTDVVVTRACALDIGMGVALLLLWLSSLYQRWGLAP